MSSLPFNWFALAFYTIASANFFILNGGLFSTEDGKLFSASFVSSQDAGLIQAQGCSIDCANLCLSSARGNSLISCYTSCSCSFLIIEVPQLPRDQIISAYYRDLGINIHSEIEEGGRSVEIEINSLPNPTTGKSEESTLVSYESEGSFQEVQVKVPDELGMSYGEYEVNLYSTQVETVSNEFFRLSLPVNYWSGEPSTKNKVGEEHVNSKMQYDIPGQGILGETAKSLNFPTDAGNLSSESTTYSNSKVFGDSLYMDFTLSPYSKTNFSSSLPDAIKSNRSSLNDNTHLSSSRSNTKSIDLNGSYNYKIEIKQSSPSHRTSNLILADQEESLFAYIFSLLLKILFLALFIAGVTLLARKFLLPKQQENTDEQAENYYIKL